MGAPEALNRQPHSGQPKPRKCCSSIHTSIRLMAALCGSRVQSAVFTFSASCEVSENLPSSVCDFDHKEPSLVEVRTQQRNRHCCCNTAAQAPEALAKQADSQRRHSRARSAWDESSQPAWLTPELFSQKIQPLLSNIATSVIRSHIGVSRWYASRIRQGYRPHPRHWQALAKLVGASGGGG